MKLIKIPYDINEYNDLSEFKDTIKDVNIFYDNLKLFADKIATKYLKWFDEWEKLLSENDLNYLKKYYGLCDGYQYLYSYKTKTPYIFTSVKYNRRRTNFGEPNNFYKIDYEFTKCGKFLIIKNEYKHYGYSSIPECGKTIFYIDYINETILTEKEYETYKNSL